MKETKSREESVKKCPRCGSEMTKTNKRYAGGSLMYKCPECGTTSP